MGQVQLVSTPYLTLSLRADVALQEIQSIEVQWSKNTEKVTLKAEICDAGGDMYYRDHLW